VLVHNTFRSIADGSEYSISAERDSGRDLHERIGELVSMRDIIYNMTILSGNLATNLVIDIVGAENVMRTMKELGANDIQVLRGVEDMLAFERGMNNRTNARDLAILYAHLAMGTAVSPESDADMISILKDQRFREMIPAGLPEGTVVAHKTGSITGIRHDSGVVYLPDGRRYVLVILTSNPVNNDDGYTLGVALSRAVYNWMR
jgi:beta-lactamase class A